VWLLCIHIYIYIYIIYVYGTLSFWDSLSGAQRYNTQYVGIRFHNIILCIETPSSPNTSGAFSTPTLVRSCTLFFFYFLYILHIIILYTSPVLTRAIHAIYFLPSMLYNAYNNIYIILYTYSNIV